MSKSKVNLDIEELNIFKSWLKKLVELSVNILNSLDKYDLVEFGNTAEDRKRRKATIDTVIKRTKLYQNYFGQTTSKDMMEHYEPFYEVYINYKSDIMKMVDQLCSKQTVNVDTSWLAENRIFIVIDKDSDIILHIKVVFQLAMELENNVDKIITEKYNLEISKASGIKRTELQEDMEDEKYDTPELSYIDRYLLCLISIFLSVSQDSTERRKLKIAASNIMQGLPNTNDVSGSSMFGGLGNLIGDVFKNMPNNGADINNGADVGQIITGALQSALGDGNIGGVLKKACESRDVGEIFNNFSEAIANPELNKAINDQVAKYDKSSSIAPPPKYGDKAPIHNSSSKSSSSSMTQKKAENSINSQSSVGNSHGGFEIIDDDDDIVLA